MIVQAPLVISNAVFRAERQHVFDAFISNLEKTNLFHNLCDSDHRHTYLEHWYMRDGQEPLYVKIIDKPGTLSGNILRLLADLPPLQTHTEIHGETIKHTSYSPPPDPLEPGKDDMSRELLQLPVVTFNERIHFSKVPRFNSEIANLLKIKGGSPHVVELLGRTEDGKLVFPLLKIVGTGAQAVKRLSIAVVKRWGVQLAEAVCFLHSHGIIHHDIKPDNVLVTKDLQSMILCDLECRWGSREAPEIHRVIELSPDERPYTEKSDVYCFGGTLNNIVMGNVSRNRWIHWSAPAPFSNIVEICQAEDPADRPTMREVKNMLETIPVPDDD